MKKVLPRDFLESVAQSHNLSPEQTEALVKRLGNGATAQETSAALHISDSALRSRMTEIYKKFSISHPGPNKLYKLRDLLWSKYQNQQKFLSQDTEDQTDIETRGSARKKSPKCASHG